MSWKDSLKNVTFDSLFEIFLKETRHNIRISTKFKILAIRDIVSLVNELVGTKSRLAYC
uniref:Uncharacterized protein n=1 Tax=Rhizophora mucronata TaxID=61149 RepID=A0A2P2NGY7_RHIMU